PHIFPHFKEELRTLAACGTVSMDMLREVIKKNAAMYCDENIKPQEMNKKDNHSAKPEKLVSQLVALSLNPHIFPHFEEELRTLAACGTVSMDMLREAIKKDAAMYCDENVEPQEMNKKDNQSAKPEKLVSQLVALSLKSISCLISGVCSPWLVDHDIDVFHKFMP
ncbi:hypothetical protein Tco_0836645, partial [Tanacetum coccineum]